MSIENIHERLPVSVSAAVIITDSQDRILLVQENSAAKDYKWGLPGGGMHANENPCDTATREVKEEIDCTVTLQNLVGIYTAFRGERASGLGFVFTGKITGEIKLNRDEIKDYRFFTQQEINHLIESNQLYKPEYNLPCLEDFYKGKRFDLTVIK